MSDQFKDIAGKHAEEAVMAPRCPNGQLYTVQSGDTLFFIAKRNNISLQSLIQANPQIVDPNTIYPGQNICIPGAAGPVAPPIAPPVGAVCPGQTYQVVRGDSMYEIAKRFGVTLDALIRANPQIPNPNEIFPGQEICIPGAPPVAPPIAPPIAPMPCQKPCMPPMVPVPVPVPPTAPQVVLCPNGTLYTVKSGDSLYTIARDNNITLASIIDANPQIPDPNMIMPGQIICVPTAMPVVPLPVIPKPPVIMPVRPCPRPPVALPVPMPIPAPPVVSPITMPCPLPPAAPPVPMPCPVMPVVPPMPCPARPVMPIPAPPVVSPIACPVRPPMPVPMPLPAPPMACPPRPAPPRPSLPRPVKPRPAPPAVSPVRCPARPPMPRPAPPAMPPVMMPCPVEAAPVYVLVPWEECPHRFKRKGGKKRKHHRHGKGCC